MDTYGRCPNRRCDAAPKLLTADYPTRVVCVRCGSILTIVTDSERPPDATERT